mmetsp:Transcript_5428/g.5965  ORF Transcript_5428/g.5965 Transcript_5428/m.5965 type:complete len:281 (+) Transcript_5428:222-1064(+)
MELKNKHHIRKREQLTHRRIQGPRDTLECSRCYEYLTGYLLCCQKNHVICRECCLEDEDFEESQKLRCPLCNGNLSENLPHTLRRKLSTLNIRCNNSELGCPEVPLLKDLHAHLSTCKFSPRKCPLLSSCSWKGVSVAEHLSSAHHLTSQSIQSVAHIQFQFPKRDFELRTFSGACIIASQEFHVQILFKVCFDPVREVFYLVAKLLQECRASLFKVKIRGADGTVISSTSKVLPYVAEVNPTTIRESCTAYDKELFQRVSTECSNKMFELKLEMRLLTV